MPAPNGSRRLKIPFVSSTRSTRSVRAGSALAAGALSAVALASACGSTHPGGGSPTSGSSSGPAANAGGSGGGGSSGAFASDDSSAPIFSGSGSSGGSGGSGGTGIGCDPTCAAAGGTCAGTTCTVADNTGSVPMTTQTALHGRGMADAAFAWLYPYDKTVFPRGITSPTLQFGGGASDAEYVHITSKTLDYQGYFAGGTAGNVALSLPQKSWDAVTAAVAAGDAATVQVTKFSGGHVTGPISEAWPIAQGSVRGTIFYETYGSMIAGGRNSVAILKIQPGAKMPTLFKGSGTAFCGAICHAASADGSTILSATNLGASASWNVASATSTTTANSSVFTYMGPYPDGTFGMSATSYNAIYTPTPASRLYDTKTGASIAAPGWDSVITLGGTPAFSPDGKKIAFMHEDKDSHTIAKMDFDAATKTFSGLVDLATESSGYVAWPAFTPDDKMVIFQSGSSATFDTDCQNTGDLYVVDDASHTLHRLDALDGYTGAGTASYLPANDPGLNFAPTVLAEAVGGYFWSVFTSHRSYGGLLASKANNPGLGFSNCTSAQGDEDDGKLWVAAIDIGSSPGQDPSHPAFYLDGQELQADNLRGYWVLPACQANGASCQTGDECCCGFCRSPSTGAAPVCVCKPKGCSNEFESCTTVSDCCAAGDQCINGRCALPAPPK
jgi:WD40-like Beta Propeller Repeat